jgi:hypothetical protein
MSDRNTLLAQIDECGNNLSNLMHDTQLRINAAVAAGKLDDADALRNQMQEISFALTAILDRQIAQIENSASMKKAIAGFAAVNKSITTELNKIQSLQDYVTALNSLLGNLNTAVGIALKQPAPAGGGGGAGGTASATGSG